jgi:hypothetical protein
VNDQIEQIEPADAARALSEIGRRREQVIRRAAAPRWFWWASAVLTIGFAADVDSQRGALFWTGVALFTAGTLAVNGLRLRAVRRAPPRGDLVAPGSVPRVLAGEAVLSAVVMGVTLATGLSLVAARVPYPATIAVAAGMAVLVAGGQALTRYHTAFLVRRPGGRG